ncbi:MAG: hypothetical protein U0903_08545 [Planctomycetales bacterium]
MKDTLGASSSIQQQTLRLLEFHPASLPLRWKLAEEYAARKGVVLRGDAAARSVPRDAET